MEKSPLQVMQMLHQRSVEHPTSSLLEAQKSEAIKAHKNRFNALAQGGSFRRKKGPSLIQRRLNSDNKTIQQAFDKASESAQAKSITRSITSQFSGLRLQANTLTATESPQDLLRKGFFDIEMPSAFAATPCRAPDVSERKDSKIIDNHDAINAGANANAGCPENTQQSLRALERGIEDFLENEKVHNVCLSDYLKQLGRYQEQIKYQEQSSVRLREKDMKKFVYTQSPIDPQKATHFEGLQSQAQHGTSPSLMNPRSRHSDKQVTDFSQATFTQGGRTKQSTSFMKGILGGAPQTMGTWFTQSSASSSALQDPILIEDQEKVEPSSAARPRTFSNDCQEELIEDSSDDE